MTPTVKRVLWLDAVPHLSITEERRADWAAYTGAHTDRRMCYVLDDALYATQSFTAASKVLHVGQPTLACIRPAVQALQDLGMHREVQLVVSGGIRTGADVAKALALGADAVSIGTAALIALGDNDPRWEAEYQKLGTTTGAYDDWHEGRDPAGITTQDPELMQRLDPVAAGLIDDLTEDELGRDP